MNKKSAAACLGVFLICAFLSPGFARAQCCPDQARLSQARLLEMVQKLTPVIVQDEDIPAAPESMLYRVKTSGDCRTALIAYHIIWPYEQDPRPGLWPAFIRMTYTGGLKLQRVIYGPGDVEVLVLTVDLATMKVVQVNFETADYDKKNGVIHVKLELTGDKIPSYTPLAFQVISWNHLFKILDAAPGPGVPIYKFTPQPFTDQLWSHYRMTKKRQTALSLDRDHPAWEDEKNICPKQ